MPLPRECANKDCKERFQPETRANKFCEKCREKANKWREKNK